MQIYSDECFATIQNSVFEGFDPTLGCKLTSRCARLNMDISQSLDSNWKKIDVNENELLASSEDYCKWAQKQELKTLENHIKRIMQVNKDQEPVKIEEFYSTHPIFKLETTANSLSKSQLSVLSNSIKTLRYESVRSTKYKTFSELIHISSALLVKWGIFKQHRYEYRNKSITRLQSFIDVYELNYMSINLDVLWFCVAIRKPPFEDRVTLEILQYSEVLEHQVDMLMRVLLTSDSIKGSRKQCVVDATSASQNFNKNLKLFSCLKFLHLFKKFENKTYKVLIEFEQAYRIFEKELLGFLFLVNKNSIVV